MSAKGPHRGLGFLVGAPRSGTSVCRTLLNAHQDIASPGEVGLPAAMGAVASLWSGLEGGHRTVAPQYSELPEAAKQAVRSVAYDAAEYFCAKKGSRVFVEKSLDSVPHLPLVAAALPDARFVVVSRHVLDVVSSALDASPFGFSGYGYLPFAQRWPGNWTAALADHWLSFAEPLIQWLREHGDRSMLVRYEDLVQEPTGVLTSMFELLGVPTDLSVLKHAFDGGEVYEPAGDFKLGFTSELHASSIGAGSRLPLSALTPLARRIDDALEALGYSSLRDPWPSIASRQQTDSALDLLGQAIGSCQVGDRPGNSGPATISVCIAPDDGPTRFTLELFAEQIAWRDLGLTFEGHARDLVRLFNDDPNVSLLLRDRRIRWHWSPAVDTSTGGAALHSVLALLRSQSSG